MRIRASRSACFPGDAIRFTTDGVVDDEVRWSGGGSPPSGDGVAFRSTFVEGGRYLVRAEARGAVAQVEIAVCPMDAWLADAQLFFGPSLDVNDVTVVSSPFVFGASTRAWTCNNVVRCKRAREADRLPSQATLIHELGHVLQHRSGQAQLLAGFVEQIRRLFGRDPYDFGGPNGVRGATTLQRFSKEAQAQIITELWKADHGAPADRLGVRFSEPGYVDDLRRLAEGAGLGISDAHRRTFVGVLDSAVAAVVNAVLKPFDQTMNA